jgi:hypothetical protein
MPGKCFMVQPFDAGSSTSASMTCSARLLRQQGSSTRCLRSLAVALRATSRPFRQRPKQQG